MPLFQDIQGVLAETQTKKRGTARKTKAADSAKPVFESDAPTAVDPPKKRRKKAVDPDAPKKKRGRPRKNPLPE